MIKRLNDIVPSRTGGGHRSPAGSVIPALLMVCGILIGANQAFAQFTTNGTGGGAWTSPSTWAGGQVPPANGSVTIATGDSVSTSLSNVVQCGGLTMQPGSKLNVIGYGIQMTGDFSIASGALYINNTDSAKAWPAGASSYTIDPNSTFELGSGGNPTLGWALSDSTFGNVIIDPNTSGLSCGANLTIKGNLIINAGQGKVFRGIAAGNSATKFVHTVMGNVTVMSGNWSAVDMGVSATVPLSCTWNVDGNVTVGYDSAALTKTARFSPITSEDDLGATGIFNVMGNLSIINGGRLAAGSNSGSNQSINQIAEVNVYGNLTFDSTATFAVNSTGNFIINFKGTKPQTVTLGDNVSFNHSGPPLCTLWDTVATGANVTFTGGHIWRSQMQGAGNGGGAFVVNGTFNIDGADTIEGVQKFIVSPGATSGIGSADGIVAAGAAIPNSGNIQNDSARVFSSEANYVYNGTSAQVTGSGLPATVNNLTIDNNAGVTLSQATTINGTLYLVAGTFDNTIPFTLGPNGKVSVTGGKLKVPTAVVSMPTVPTKITIGNYPNPFNPTTQIQFSVTKNAHVALSIYDELGQKVATLVDGNLAPGVYNKVFNGARYASGVYFARLTEGSHIVIAKMLMIK